MEIQRRRAESERERFEPAARGTKHAREQVKP